MEDAGQSVTLLLQVTLLRDVFAARCHQVLLLPVGENVGLSLQFMM